MSEEYHRGANPESLTRSRGLAAQLGYAERRKPTFPCKQGGKEPLTPRGFKEATTDRSRITAWRNCWPLANIGMPTGGRSGVFVLDVDRPEALGELETEIGPLPATLSARTPRGGLHLYFRHVEGLTNSPGGLPPGIDVRGEGGYVLVPPSSGYRWEGRSPLADAPLRLLELLRERSSPPRRGSATPRGGDRGGDPQTHCPGPVDANLDGPTIPEGRRNTELVSIAGRLHDGTRTEEDLAAEVAAIRDARCEDPGTFTDTEIRAIVHWIASKEPCRTGRPIGVEERVRAIEAAFWERWGEYFRGLGGQSDRDLLRAALEGGARWGRLSDTGEVEFDMSAQEMALAAGLSRPTVIKAARRLEDLGLLRRDSRNRGKATNAGRWVLLTPPTPQTFTTRTKGEFSRKEERIGGVVKSRGTPRVVGLRTPTFRHFSAVGKGRGGVLLALEAFGPLPAEELAEELGIARADDLRRRYLDPLVEEGRVELHGGRYALPGDHSERCEEAKNRAYGRVIRRKVRTTSAEGLPVTEVREYDDVRSERRREEDSRRAYAEQRRDFYERLGVPLEDPSGVNEVAGGRRPSPGGPPRDRRTWIGDAIAGLFADRPEFKARRVGQITCELRDYLEPDYPRGPDGYPKDDEVEEILDGEVHAA